MKILCCGFFPAIQRTIEFRSFQTGTVNRALDVSVSVGGKAANTARALKHLGADPLILSFAGGENGKTVRRLLEQEQIPCRLVETGAQTRLCQTLLSKDSGSCTELVENSAPPSGKEWNRFLDVFSELQKECDRIILSGNLPPNAPQDIYAGLLSLTDPARTLLDTSGEPLITALDLRPGIVKINAEELKNTFKTEASVQDLTQELIDQGAGAAGITQGKEDAMLRTPELFRTFTLPQINVLNPTGSGDSVNAGIVYALQKGLSLPEAFVFGLACGISNALNRDPGAVIPEQIAGHISGITPV